MLPLSKRVRAWTLRGLVFVFIVGAPILIGYTKGYRIDDALGLIQTGGIYIHTDVSNAAVFLDDEYVRNNGIFLKNVLIQNLLPNRYYEVRIEHPRHQSWVKVLPVQPKLVTEARALMLPKVFTWRHVVATTTVKMDPSLLRTENSLATTTLDGFMDVPNPEFLEFKEFFEEDRDQFSIDIATSTYETIAGVMYPTTTTIEIIRFPTWMSAVASTSALESKTMVRERQGIVAWLEEGDLFAVWGKEGESPPYFFCNKVCVEKQHIDWQEPIQRYEFFPNRNDVVILLTERGIFAVELDGRSERNIQVILEEPDLDFRIKPNGSLVVYDGTEFKETTF